ncbi:Pre-mRNA-splicing factor slt11 [Cryomyces minteri]|uniref:Pre-mRNA-splicing factor slt11 n=1 Tax=Cryomyces minteri TaxID=331657 RepID=A0A4U0XLS6_9PEZI|nr:Pre-mRNA-splicing factor slt11 [Cryomyces minteri]
MEQTHAKSVRAPSPSFAGKPTAQLAKSCCMLDLSFGLPIVVRDAALKMIAPGPESTINREYYAQEHEKEIEEGRGGVEAYEKTDEKARDLLRRLANSEPYYKKQRRLEAERDGDGQKLLGAPEVSGEGARHTPGPVRTRDSGPRSNYGPRGAMRGGRGGARGGRAFPSAAQLPPQPQDILPPADPNITSLFITGVEDDLPEHEIRTFFSKFGTLRSVVCSHRSHCAFINYTSREGAETAADGCQGKAIVKGVPLRVQWGKPKPLDTMERDQRMTQARAGRDTVKAASAAAQPAAVGASGGSSVPVPAQDDFDSMSALAPPPGTGDVTYASLAGN